MPISKFGASQNKQWFDMQEKLGRSTGNSSLLMYGAPYNRNALDTLESPAVSWNFRILLPEITGNTNAINESKTPPGDWLSKTKELIKDYGLNVESIDFSLPSITSNPRKYCGRDMNFPGRVNVDSFAIKFYEDSDYTVTNYLIMWRQKVINDVGDYGLPAQYKKPIVCWAYNCTGEKQTTFKLLGCFPEKIGGYNFDNSNSGLITLNCAFSCDWVSFF